MTYYNSAVNPFTNVIDRPYSVRSESKGGSTDNVIGATDISISTAANYPPTESGTSTSFYVYMPMAAFYTSTNSSDFTVRNETQAFDLTIVDTTAVLTGRSCKFFTTDSRRSHIIEVDVSSTSNNEGDTLSYEGLFVGSVLRDSDINEMSVNSLAAGNLTINHAVIDTNAGSGLSLSPYIEILDGTTSPVSLDLITSTELQNTYAGDVSVVQSTIVGAGVGFFTYGYSGDRSENLGGSGAGVMPLSTVSGILSTSSTRIILNEKTYDTVRGGFIIYK